MIIINNKNEINKIIFIDNLIFLGNKLAYNLNIFLKRIHDAHRGNRIELIKKGKSIMIINLLSSRDISYRLNDMDKINKIEYIISFPSGYKYNFPVHLEESTGELIISLPILKDIIKFEFDGVGYIQLYKEGGLIKELFKEVIRFVDMETTEMNIESEPDFSFEVTDMNRAILKTNEVIVSHSNTLQFIMDNVDRNKK